MQARGPLMTEHRLIERMIELVRRQVDEGRRGGGVDPAFAGEAVDFVRTYADRTHHGKEEDILFRDLARKDLSPEDRRLMEELVAEHRQGRHLVGEIVAARQGAVTGEEGAMEVLLEKLEELTHFYPRHIAKEDDVFFPAAMGYLSDSEQEGMLREFREFDREMIHEKYRAAVEKLEGEG